MFEPIKLKWKIQYTAAAKIVLLSPFNCSLNSIQFTKLLSDLFSKSQCLPKNYFEFRWIYSNKISRGPNWQFQLHAGAKSKKWHGLRFETFILEDQSILFENEYLLFGKRTTSREEWKPSANIVQKYSNCLLNNLNKYIMSLRMNKRMNI